MTLPVIILEKHISGFSMGAHMCITHSLVLRFFLRMLTTCSRSFLHSSFGNSRGSSSRGTSSTRASCGSLLVVVVRARSGKSSRF